MLKQRIITALVLLPFALGGFFLLNGALFALFIGAVVSLGAWEWARLAGFTARLQRVAYAALVAVLLFGLYLLPALAPWVLLLWGCLVGCCDLSGLGLPRQQSLLDAGSGQIADRFADSAACLAGSGAVQAVA